MKIRTRQFDKRRGAAMILVIVVTVLLAVIGVMFMMVSRLSETETAAVANSRDLDAGVQAVVNKISDVLLEDLFGGDTTLLDASGSDERYDGNTSADAWLCSLEPVIDDNGTPSDTTDDVYVWSRITDLWDNNFGLSAGNWIDPDDDQDSTQWATGSLADYPVSTQNVRAIVIGQKDRTKVILEGADADAWDDAAQTLLFGARADAAGDGVADSRWVRIPGLTTGKGKSVYAAVRIIDNAAMLNLNAAHCFYQEPYDEASPRYVDASGDPVSPFAKPWFQDDTDYSGENFYHDNTTGSGRYLTEINYLPFLRGSDLGTAGWFTGSGDNWDNLMIAKEFYNLDASDDIISFDFTPMQGQDALDNMEISGEDYHFFDLADELELRNRYLLTSPVEARFERDDVANFTLDSGGGVYAALTVPRDNSGNGIGLWEKRIDPLNFDDWSGATAGDEYVYDRRHVCTFYSFDRNLTERDDEILDVDLTTGLAADAIAQVEKVFRPIGPVTTNIETSTDTYAYDDTALTVGYPYQTSFNNIESRRKILHLLFGLREYYYANSGDLNDAVRRAAQTVANIIDYSDDTGTDGPFAEMATADIDYGQQLDQDCTFLTEEIIQDMIFEVSTEVAGLGITQGTIPFGLDVGEVIFGYERQPFISEVYARRDAITGHLQEFAIELANPYSTDIYAARPDTTYLQDEDAWRIKVGDGSIVNHPIGDIFQRFPQYNTTQNTPGRYVVAGAPSVSLATGPLAVPRHTVAELHQLGNISDGNYEIQLRRPAPVNSGVDFIVVDRVPSDTVRQLFLYDYRNALKRSDADWRLIYADHQLQRESVSGEYTHTLGQANNVTTGPAAGFQLAVADNEFGLSRWHELETLAWYGPIAETGDPNETMTQKLADDGGGSYFDLTSGSADLLDYVCTMNRPDRGTLPGRININTAPAHVIAAAIPPTLADPNAADPTETVTFSALDMAEAIVDYRQNGPFSTLGDLLNVPGFTQYTTGGTWEDTNVGQQSIDNDIEERHWVLSNLANKLTVRSDVFTAYILVRLGEDGPQRRMIAIFDRSGVWEDGDRPKLVALHPVPDPR